ncbi:LysE family translocator [Comamonas odontotermitis]|uniref:LysE family translocator n=1 Tax=Comamonas odontotermitis TaxID=379895 RepID=UPI00366CECC5
MSYLVSLLTIAGIYLAVLASPGPNFFILSQLALQGEHMAARFVVLGLTTGSIFWVVLALAGLSTLLAQHPWLATGVRVAGAAYLVWYGAGLLRSAVRSRRNAESGTVAQTPRLASRMAAYRSGLLTGVTNPKGAAFWTSAFAALVPLHAPAWFHVATVLLVTCLSLGWHLGITWGSPGDHLGVRKCGTAPWLPTHGAGSQRPRWRRAGAAGHPAPGQSLSICGGQPRSNHRPAPKTTACTASNAPSHVRAGDAMPSNVC